MSQIHEKCNTDALTEARSDLNSKKTYGMPDHFDNVELAADLEVGLRKTAE